MRHELKTKTQYFQRVWDKEKLFETRFDDREFQKGDTVVLQETIEDEIAKTITGREIYAEIGFVLYELQKEGYVTFSLINPRNEEDDLPLPNPRNTEIERLKKEISKLKEKHDKQLYGVRKGVAQRRNVTPQDVMIGATLCNSCSTIICKRHTNRLYCDKCKGKK